MVVLWQFKRTKRNGRKRSLFLMFSRIGLCVSLKIFLSGQWDCWIWCFEFIFIVILSELIIQCVISSIQTRVLAHYLCTLLNKKLRIYLRNNIWSMFLNYFCGFFLGIYFGLSFIGYEKNSYSLNYLTLRSVSSLNNPQNSEMKFCENIKLTCWKSS